MKRFWDKVNKLKKDECWLWRASKDNNNYGRFKFNKVCERAHVVSFMLHNNVDKKSLFGKVIMHKCDNPSCVNPEHLLMGTQTENNADMCMKKRNRGPAGENNWNHKLTLKQVKYIRKKYSDRKTSTEKIAKRYNVSQPMISYILINKSWNF